MSPLLWYVGLSGGNQPGGSSPAILSSVHWTIHNSLSFHPRWGEVQLPRSLAAPLCPVISLWVSSILFRQAQVREIVRFTA